VISHTTSRFWKAYRQLDENVQKKARRAYELFEQNPQHPSLHFKKVHPTEPLYSARVSLNHRALGMRDGNEIVWFWIGPHDEYERLIGM
jgi:hypothetical protein